MNQIIIADNTSMIGTINQCELEYPLPIKKSTVKAPVKTTMTGIINPSKPQPCHIKKNI